MAANTTNDTHASSFLTTLRNEARQPILSEELRQKKKGKPLVPLEGITSLGKEVTTIPRTNIEVLLPQQPLVDTISKETQGGEDKTRL